MKGRLGEPERWSDRAFESASGQDLRTRAEDEVGALFRRVREATGTVPSALEPSHAATVRRNGRGVGRLLRPLAPAALIVAVTGGVVNAARSVWRAVTAQPQSLLVGRGSRAILNQRRHRKLTVVGPARLDLDRGGDEWIQATLDGGALTAESGDRPLLVRANGLLVTLAVGASGRVAGSSGGVEAVEALGGEVRVTQGANGETTALAAGHRWPEPLAAARTAPVAVPPNPPAAVKAIAPRPAAAPVDRPRRNSGETAHSEASLVAQAFRALRADHDPPAALRALDDWARRFPEGALSDEARVARVEALLALQRKAEALPLLLEIRDRSQGLTREIQLARAEILAEQGRCAEALADFDALMSGGDDDDAGERALYGRAGCRLRSGETAGARQDLRRYLELYPAGRFSGAVRRAAGQLNAVAAP